MTKHTPGPWDYVSVPASINWQGCHIWRIESEDEIDPKTEEPVCIAGIWGDEDVDEANARLIAAAPELLEALQMVMQHGRIDDSESRMNMVAAAIMKATGGTS